MEAVYSMVIHDLYQNGLYVDEDTLEYVPDINMKHVRIQGSTVVSYPCVGGIL